MANDEKPGKKKTTQLALVKDPPPSTQQAVQSLDIDALRDNMVKGIYTLEAALFTQSGFEYERIEKLRTVISETEKTLLDPAYIASLSAKDRIRLYGLMLNNMNTSLLFLQGLHGSITSGIEAISHIEKLKSQKGASSKDPNVNPQKLDQIKQLLISKIKDKTEQNSK
jgi:hypothetical protein